MNVNNQLIYENHSNSSENFASTGSSVEKFENQTNSLNIASKETTQNSGPSNKEKSSGSNQQDAPKKKSIKKKKVVKIYPVTKKQKTSSSNAVLNDFGNFARS